MTKPIDTKPWRMEVGISKLEEPVRVYFAWLRQRYGLTETAADLIALTAVQGACGRLRLIMNPLDGTPVTPAFSTVIHGSPGLLIQSAVNQCLAPIHNWVDQRIGNGDLSRVPLQIAELHERLIEITALTALADRVPDPGTDGMYAPAKEREASRQNLDDEAAYIDEAFLEQSFRLRPHIISTDSNLTRLLDPGSLSADGTVVHVCIDGLLIGALKTATRAHKFELSGLLSNSWSGRGRGSLAILMVTDANVSKELFKIGVCDYLLFAMGSDPDAVAELDLGCPEEVALYWSQGMRALLDQRLRGHPVTHHLGEAATRTFTAFTQDLLEQVKGDAKRMERAAVLGLKLTLLLHAISSKHGEEDIGEAELVAGCCIALEACLNEIDLTKAGTVEKSRDCELDKLVAKLTVKGETTWRALHRSFHKVKADDLRLTLSKAIQRGLVRRDGELSSQFMKIPETQTGNVSARQPETVEPILSDPHEHFTRVLRPLKCVPWPAAIPGLRRLPANGICKADRRQAAADLMEARLVRFQMPALFIVNRGALVLEPAQCPIGMRAGDCALVAPGLLRVTEVGVVDYWRIFFNPRVLHPFLNHNVRALAELVNPAFSGVYPVRNFLPMLRSYGISDPLEDINLTFRALFAKLPAPLFMFLKNHFYSRQHMLERFLDVARIAGQPVAEGFPGSPLAFRRDCATFQVTKPKGRNGQ